MALLTEEQINDILDIANVCSSSTSAKKLIEWNKKQTAQQIEVDWNDAPKHATKAMLRLHWVTETLGSELWSTAFDSVTFERPAPVITPHPHAELIAKFAEVAARRVDPWMEFEYKNSVSGNWEKTISTISFFHDAEYRYIGDNK